ncbi:MAG TPA: STAS domain-containing protein [Verrucomicrobiae bacterium]|nr:STAS domain-containing protein [Verrucomicrobiae bacterium]
MNESHLSVLKLRDLLLVTVPAEADDTTVSALQQKVLEAMERHEPKAVVMDISLVETLDSFFARTISETAQMINIMGSRAIIAGMQPAVAVAATEIGLKLGSIEASLNVDRALDLAEKPRRGHTSHE